MITKIKSALILMIAVGVVWSVASMSTGKTGDDDDESREINIIALASNDTLNIRVIVHSSVRGRVLDVPAAGVREPTFNVDDIHWDTTVRVQKNERVRISIRAWAYSNYVGDPDSWVRCRIVDNGQRVRDERREVHRFRTTASVECAYVT